MEEEFKIPNNIKILIDLEFLSLFKQNLCKVFNKDDMGTYGVTCSGGTGGWQTALKNTCSELKKLEVLRYYNELEWFNSDYFDSEISDMMLERGLIEDDIDNINNVLDVFGLSLDYEDDSDD
jgi:hypothetical protein